MIITFVGHSSMMVDRNLSKEIREAILSNIKQDASVTFYCGGYGDFDRHCATMCRQLKETIPSSEIIFVTPYIAPSYQKKLKHLIDTELYDTIIYPPIENTPPRFAITKRNEWMVSQADFIIAYVSHSYGGAYKTLSYAKRKQKAMINLAES